MMKVAQEERKLCDVGYRAEQLRGLKCPVYTIHSLLKTLQPSSLCYQDLQED